MGTVCRLPVGMGSLLDTRAFAAYVSGMAGSGWSIRGVAPWVIAAGGLLMAALWLLYTWLHGPTTFQEDHHLLGRDVHFWGMLLGVVPNSLIAVGLIALRGWLAAPGRLAAAGHGLICGALVVPAVLDLTVQAINAPFFLPVQAAGLFLLAAGLRSPIDQGTLRTSLVVLGGLLGAGMMVAFLPQDFSDSIGGFRIFGVFAYFLAGLAWSGVGYALHNGTPGKADGRT